jgi:hypothetical protein
MRTAVVIREDAIGGLRLTIVVPDHGMEAGVRELFDRVEGDELSPTQQLLSEMLEVRRSHVTAAASAQ